METGLKLEFSPEVRSDRRLLLPKRNLMLDVLVDLTLERSHHSATDVPFIACVINSPCTFTYYLDLSNFTFIL